MGEKSMRNFALCNKENVQRWEKYATKLLQKENEFGCTTERSFWLFHTFLSEEVTYGDEEK